MTNYRLWAQIGPMWMHQWEVFHKDHQMHCTNQKNLIQQVVRLEWDQELRDVVQGNNASIEGVVAEIHRVKQAMGTSTNGMNEAFGGVRVDAQSQNQAMQTLSQQIGALQNRLVGVDNEVTRLQSTEIEALKERCRKVDVDNLATGRRWPAVNKELRKSRIWTGSCECPRRKLPT